MLYYVYDKVFKEKMLGPGEWVDEPDFTCFVVSGIQCVIRRVMYHPTPLEIRVFGGHFCGYVEIPSYHPLYKKSDDYFEGQDLECHGGITFNNIDMNECHLIGFDCAHSGDLVPSIEKDRNSGISSAILKQINQEIKKELKISPLFIPVYRNFEYVYQECTYLAQQVAEKNNHASQTS